MTTQTHTFKRAGFIRRIAAMIYDILVATAIGLCAGLVGIPILTALLENDVLDKQGYEHVSDLIQHSFAYTLAIQLWIGFWIVAFFTWFWRNGGQTLGMRAWRLRLFSTNDKPFTYSRALLRIVCSLGGLGTLLVLFDVKNKQSLQDRLTHTEILALTKDANDHKAWRSI